MLSPAPYRLYCHHVYLVSKGFDLSFPFSRGFQVQWQAFLTECTGSTTIDGICTAGHSMQFGGFNLLLPTVTRLKALYLKARTCSNLGDYCTSGLDSVSYLSKLWPLIGLPNCNYQFGVKRERVRKSFCLESVSP